MTLMSGPKGLISIKKFNPGQIQPFAEKLNSGGHCEERKRRGNLIMLDFIMNKIASLRPAPC
jgi:hypothetical protein